MPESSTLILAAGSTFQTWVIVVVPWTGYGRSRYGRTVIETASVPAQLRVGRHHEPVVPAGMVTVRVGASLPNEQ